jgi:fido (protein-threonine AMPylation protein)
LDDASEEGAFSFCPGLTTEELRTEVAARDFQFVQRLLRDERRRPGQWRASFLTWLHREIFGYHFPDQAGTFRLAEANYGIRAAVRPEHIQPLLEQLVLDIQGALRAALLFNGFTERFFDHVFLTAATQHAEMIRIHPFVDGNGRWARLATSLYLYDCGLECGTIIFARDRKAYVDAIHRAQDTHEPGDLANILLEGFLSQSERRVAGLRPRTP